MLIIGYFGDNGISLLFGVTFVVSEYTLFPDFKVVIALKGLLRILTLQLIENVSNSVASIASKSFLDAMTTSMEGFVCSSIEAFYSIITSSAGISSAPLYIDFVTGNKYCS